MKFTVETVKRKNRLGLKSADFYLRCQKAG